MRSSAAPSTGSSPPSSSFSARNAARGSTRSADDRIARCAAVKLIFRGVQRLSAVPLIRSTPVHYGWVILAAGTFGSFMTLPGQTAGVSVFFDPITTDLHISRTSASVAYAVGTLAGILPAPVIGRWIDRRGPRLTATIIAGGLALACVCMAFVESVLTLLIGFALLRGMAIGGLSLVSQQVVNLWFVHRRGIAAAAASLGLAAGSMVFPQLIDLLISLYGWRGAYLALALLVALTILPIAAALFRDRPEKFGLTTDAGLRPVATETREEPSFTRKQALRTGRLLASLRCRLPDQCRRYGASAQPLLDHADGRNRRGGRAERLGGLCGRSGGGHTRYGGLAGSL